MYTVQSTQFKPDTQCVHLYVFGMDDAIDFPNISFINRYYENENITLFHNLSNAFPAYRSTYLFFDIKVG